MKILAVLLAAALLSSGCASHPHHAVKRLRRAPGESAEDFAERKEEVKEYAEEVRETRKENAQDAKARGADASDGPQIAQ